MVHFYKKEFKDKKKDWDIVETSFGCCGFDLCIYIYIIFNIYSFIINTRNN